MHIAWVICIYLKKWLSEVKWYHTHFSHQIQWRGWHHAISFNKQVHTIPHPVLQVPACSQEAVDSTDTNIGNKKYRYILRTIQRVLGKCWVGEQKLLSPSHTLIYSSSYFCTTSLQNQSPDFQFSAPINCHFSTMYPDDDLHSFTTLHISVPSHIGLSHFSSNYM